MCRVGDHRRDESAAELIEKAEEKARQDRPKSPDQIPTVGPNVYQAKGKGRDHQSKLRLDRAAKKHLLSDTGENGDQDQAAPIHSVHQRRSQFVGDPAHDRCNAVDHYAKENRGDGRQQSQHDAQRKRVGEGELSIPQTIPERGGDGEQPVEKCRLPYKTWSHEPPFEIGNAAQPRLDLGLARTNAPKRLSYRMINCRSWNKSGVEGEILDESIFKAYDIRGVYPDSLNEEVARNVGRAFVHHLGLRGSRVVVARDMRLSGEALENAFVEGVTESGADVLDLGMVSTDALYFAVGHLEEPGGAMITASHNPKDYNGLKLCREDAIALSGDEGIGHIQNLITSGKLPEPAECSGSVEEDDLTEEYAEHCVSFIDTEDLRPLKIVVDAGNGMAGKMLPPVFEKLPFEYIPMYFELDGSFPNHPPNPIEPENVEELQKKVVEEGADFGVAFDGDADRCFVIDEQGNIVSGDLLATLVAKNVLEKESGATILYSAVCSKALPELIEREGGKAVRTRAGHSIIKPQMRKNDAAFGAEHSGHFYFRDNYFADSGIIAMLTVAELVARQNSPISELLDPVDPYVRSGEINSEVEDQDEILQKIEDQYSGAETEIDHLDGLTVDHGDWWFNLRPSNTEPLLRLNVEAEDSETMEQKRDELLELIQG